MTLQLPKPCSYSPIHGGGLCYPKAIAAITQQDTDEVIRATSYDRTGKGRDWRMALAAVPESWHLEVARSDWLIKFGRYKPEAMQMTPVKQQCLRKYLQTIGNRPAVVVVRGSGSGYHAIAVCGSEAYDSQFDAILPVSQYNHEIIKWALVDRS